MLPDRSPGKEISSASGRPVVVLKNGRARIGLPFELPANPAPSLPSMKKSPSTPSVWQSLSQQPRPEESDWLYGTRERGVFFAQFVVSKRYRRFCDLCESRACFLLFCVLSVRWPIPAAPRTPGLSVFVK